jgi:hypothetical protein
MPASYPSSIRAFTNKVDLVDTILADHVNALQDEVRAMQIVLGATALGGNPLTSNYAGAFSTTTEWTSLDERLNNIEAGLVSGTGASSPYVKKSGDAIQPTAGSVGLTLKTLSGSSNLFDTRASDNTLGFNVSSTGIPKVASANVLYVGSTEYNTLNTTANNALATAEAVRFDPFLLAGM